MQKQRRRELREALAEERKAHIKVDTEADLRRRLADLEVALRDAGQDGVHNRRHARSLDDIEDDAQRFTVLKARVERLEALWTVNRRKRETRGKIIIGGEILAELIDAMAAGESGILAEVLDLLDRRVETPRDRLTVKELLGDASLPLRSQVDPSRLQDGPLERVFEGVPDFDAIAHSAMAEESFRPSEIDDDYADLDANWRPAP